MQTTGDNDAVVWWQEAVAGHDVGLGVQVLADVTREFQGAEAARHGDRLMAVGVDDGGGKNAGGIALSLGHQVCPIGLGARGGG